ncbi:hypothetical protein [Phaeobacter inhibens]|uniref:hypothetical protein n=1 Tax=Phaeobacter inhibens TaxID=221822 RepID=UPI002492EE19|nr:hypothetical protein [Phaeobacter inhibens]
MSDKKASNSHSSPDGAHISVDLDMSDAALGATLRGVLGNLSATEFVTLSPDAGRETVKRMRQMEAVRRHRRKKATNKTVAAPTEGVVASAIAKQREKAFEKLRHYTVSVMDFIEAGAETLASTADVPSGDPLDQAIQAADARGRISAMSLLENDEMLTTADIVERVGISRQAVAKRRDNGTILALKAGPKALKYPDWQILPTGQVAPGIEDVLALVDGDAWTAYRFLIEAAPDGTDRPLYQLLREGDIDTVLAHIDGVLGGAGT